MRAAAKYGKSRSAGVALEYLASFFDPQGGVRLSPATQDHARMQQWMAVVGGALDGIIAKDLASIYTSGGANCRRPDKAARQCTTDQLAAPPGLTPFTVAAADLP